MAMCFAASGALAEGPPIAQSEIASLQQQLEATKEARSSARKKLAIRRITRASESLLEKQADAPNRFEVLGILFSAQQQQLQIDDSATNRRAFLKTATQLAEAPKRYAALRLDADLLLSQTALAQGGADVQARADALKPLVDRYRDTEVEAKVIRIAMVMAIELGDAGLIQHLRDVIAQRMPGDYEMIRFQRDKLAGQVFGAPFVGTFKRSDGKMARFPMDAMGKTTALYFWSMQDDGVEQLKALAEAWEAVPAESNAASRYQFVSFNLDGLPDAGESILREAGLDWPALHLPGGRDSDVYKTYVRADPKLLTMTPTGYTAMVMSGATRPSRGWQRTFQSGLARSWAKFSYANQMQSLLAGEFLVVDPTGDFDPASPPELKAVTRGSSDQTIKLDRTDESLPAETLQAIQDCFTKQPQRAQLTYAEVKANYERAVSLSDQAIAARADASDLWIVRNRRMVALQGLWKLTGERSYFDAAAREAAAALESGYPAGADIVARFCLLRQAMRDSRADPSALIDQFVDDEDGQPAAATTYAVASLLALEVGDRPLHEHYRRLSLDRYAEHPMLWNATSFLLNRYHRYWLYHPPFTAGWTYGRRMGHFLAIGTADDASRSIQVKLQTLEGEAVQLPDHSNDQWSIIHFAPTVDAIKYAERYSAFIDDRPFDDVNVFVAVLNDDAEVVRAALARTKQQSDIPVLHVPGGMKNPVVQQLGILEEDGRANIAIVRPDGSIASMISSLTMRDVKSNVMQNVLEWHDERAVDDALARGDLDEAKRLAFAYAPVEQIRPADAPKNWKPRTLTVPHLRSRAKVYAAMGDWEAALADAQAVYLEVNKKAGWLSMRTADLEETERLRDRIQAALHKPASTD